jgi:3-oxoacyl-[acyl-carrier protein] reductase
MDLGLRSRTAIVTGASTGIGSRIAMQLAEEGVTVVVAARRLPLLETLAAESKKLDVGRVIPIYYDLYEDDAPIRLANDAREAVGPIDILVNCAGGARRFAFDVPRSSWEEAMTINFWRTRELTHEVVPSMRERGWGRIVNFTGSSEPAGLSGAAVAKAAIHAWSKGLSRTIAADGVTVNCIQPGRIHSEQLTRMFPTPEAEAAEIAEMQIPAGRFGEPIEAANVAIFLASTAASFVNGAVIPVDGGMRRYAF